MKWIYRFIIQIFKYLAHSPMRTCTKSAEAKTCKRVSTINTDGALKSERKEADYSETDVKSTSKLSFFTCVALQQITLLICNALYISNKPCKRDNKRDVTTMAMQLQDAMCTPLSHLIPEKLNHKAPS